MSAMNENVKIFNSRVINFQTGLIESRNCPEGEIFALGDGSWRIIGTVPGNFHNILWLSSGLLLALVVRT